MAVVTQVSERSPELGPRERARPDGHGCWTVVGGMVGFLLATAVLWPAFDPAGAAEVALCAPVMFAALAVIMVAAAGLAATLTPPGPARFAAVACAMPITGAVVTHGALAGLWTGSYGQYLYRDLLAGRPVLASVAYTLAGILPPFLVAAAFGGVVVACIRLLSDAGRLGSNLALTGTLLALLIFAAHGAHRVLMALPGDPAVPGNVRMVRAVPGDLDTLWDIYGAGWPEWTYDGFPQSAVHLDGCAAGWPTSTLPDGRIVLACYEAWWDYRSGVRMPGRLILQDADGTQRELSDHAAAWSPVVLTPSGAWLIYARLDGWRDQPYGFSDGLNALRLSDGAVVALTDAPLIRPRWESDGTLIALYLDPPGRSAEVAVPLPPQVR